jgi:hypothetical protein
MLKEPSCRGSVTILAIVVMLFLGLVIAGLLPMLNMELRSAQSDRDALEARYVAEAGVKHALIVLRAKGDQSVFSQPNRFAGDAAKTYSVTITNAGQVYTIESVGTAGGISHRAWGTYADANVPGQDNPVFDGPNNDPQYVNATKYGILSGGTLTVYNGTYTNPIYGNEYALATTAGTPGFQWGPEVTTSVTQVLLDMFEAGFFSATSPRLDTYTKHPVNEIVNPGVQGLEWSNIWTVPVFPAGKQMYEVSGDVVFNLNSHQNEVLRTGAFPNQVVIYSHGNIIVNCRMEGNFVLIADGTITLNGDNTDIGQIELYSQGNMTVDHRIGTAARPATSYGVFMTRSNLTVHGNMYNKAFMFGRSSVKHDGGGTMYGAMYSLGNITISSAMTFVYDPSVIP